MSKEIKPTIRRMGNWERSFKLVQPRRPYAADTKITIGWIDDGDASRAFFKVNDKLVEGYEAEGLLSMLAMHTIAFPQNYRGFLEEIR